MSTNNKTKKPRRPPEKKGFITAWSEKRGCWLRVPKSTPSVVKKRMSTREGAVQVGSRGVEKWSVEFSWENRRKVIRKIKCVSTYDSITEAAEANDTTRATIQRIAGGVYGHHSQTIGGKPYTYVFTDGKKATKKASRKFEREAKRKDKEYRKKLKEQGDTKKGT